MKNLKKIFALVMALAMILSLAVPAMANGVDNDHSITIQETNSGHQYNAYQIFKGKVVVMDHDNNAQTVDVKILTDVAWGDSIRSDKIEELIADLKSSTKNPQYYTYYAGITYPTAPGADATEEDTAKYNSDLAKLPGLVAEALANKSEAAHANAFASIVDPYLPQVYKSTNELTEGTGYIISGLSDGYYLVKEDAESNIGSETATDYIVQLVENVSLKPKDGLVTVDKAILEGGNRVNLCANNMGDKVAFEIDGTLPANLAEFDNFYYAFVDTLSAGLTLDEDSIVVKTVNGDTIRTIVNPEGATPWYTVYTDDEANAKVSGSNLIIEFADLKALTRSDEYTVRSTTTIRVEYKATVNETAEIGNPGNPNEVMIRFTRDPYDPDSRGNTPEDVVRVFTFQLDVTKINGETNAKLANVEFVVSREREGKSQYAVLNGSKVTGWTNWLEAKDVADYVNNHAEYSSLSADEKEAKITALSAKPGIATRLTTDANGTFSVIGLDLDLYWLTETKALDGYNEIDPIKFTISADYDEVNNKTKNLQITIDNVPADGNADNGVVATTVVNNPGHTLPSTGGMGTTVFYVVGGLLVAAAIVLLVTKKRMNTAD